MKKFIGIMSICGILATSSFMGAFAEESMVIAPAPQKYSVTVNDEKLDLGANEAYILNDKIMIPLRRVAEKLGFKVEWDAENKGVKLDNGEVNTELYIGTDNYYMASSTAIGMSAPTTLGAAPELKDGTTFVPADMFGILYCDSNAVKVDNGMVSIKEEKAQIPNPFTEHKKMADGAKAVSFGVKMPSYLPSGYGLADISTASDDFIQIFFKNRDDEILYRMAEGTDNISGDYNIYKNTKTVNVNGTDVTMRGNENITGATWTSDGMSYSIMSDKELSEAEMKKIISSVEDVRF